MQDQQQFTLTDLTGDDLAAIMNGLNELQAKQSRLTMNKLEAQIIKQVQQQQAAAQKQDKKSAE
jgi:hypothetical protein